MLPIRNAVRTLRTGNHLPILSQTNKAFNNFPKYLQTLKQYERNITFNTINVISTQSTRNYAKGKDKKKEKGKGEQLSVHHSFPNVYFQAKLK